MTSSIYYWNPVKQKISDLKGIREEYPTASIPEGADIGVLGYFPLLEQTTPQFNPLTHTLTWVVGQQQSPNGPVYFRKYSVSELPSEVIELKLNIFLEEQKKSFVATAQARLDSFAKEKGYDDIKSAIGYLQSSIPQFKSEAETCLQKRDAMWFSLFQVLDKVQNKEIPLPENFSGIEEYLPELNWN